MTLKVTDNQYGRLSYRQLGFLLHLCASCSINTSNLQSIEGGDMRIVDRLTGGLAVLIFYHNLTATSTQKMIVNNYHSKLSTLFVLARLSVWKKTSLKR